MEAASPCRFGLYPPSLPAALDPAAGLPFTLTVPLVAPRAARYIDPKGG